MAAKPTRAEWEARHCRNDPLPPWRLSTWRERVALVLLACVPPPVIVAALIATLVLLDMALVKGSH